MCSIGHIIQYSVAYLCAETDSASSDANSDEDSFRTESPSTSQIENPTPSHITLLIYSHADFSYVDDTWLPGFDDMMDNE